MDTNSYMEAENKDWDRFVMETSVNGVFLQTRKFLSYHPAKRFMDCSVVIREKEKIIAVCPACYETDSGRKNVISHKGSTYGGLIVAPEVFRTNKIMQIIDSMEVFYRNQNIKKIVYKMTPDIISGRQSDLLNFCLRHAGYKERQELNFYIDFQYYEEDVFKNFNQCRKRNVHTCMKQGMYGKQISEDEDIREFFSLLCESLNKYKVAPVHSFSELLRLRDMFGQEIRFMGVYLEDRMVAGTMLFYFEQTKCLHTQYLAADPSMEKLSPMSFLYYYVIQYAKKTDCRYLSWGIATDHDGNLNMGLIQAKEAVGSRQTINRIFEKEI